MRLLSVYRVFSGQKEERKRTKTLKSDDFRVLEVCDETVMNYK